MKRPQISHTIYTNFMRAINAEPQITPAFRQRVVIGLSFITGQSIETAEPVATWFLYHSKHFAHLSHEARLAAAFLGQLPPNLCPRCHGTSQIVIEPIAGPAIIEPCPCPTGLIL
jgi:hypothetical protein